MAKKRGKKTGRKSADVAPPPIAAGGLRLDWVEAGQLMSGANPRNWRTHPDSQKQALLTSLSRLGWAGAALFNETTGRLVNGHLRVKAVSDDPRLGPSTLVPTLIGAWTEEQEREILITHDSITGMAGIDQEMLQGLLDDANLDGIPGFEELTAGLDQLIDDSPSSETEPEESGRANHVRVKYSFSVIAQCRDETHQAEIHKLLRDHGVACRLHSMNDDD